FEVFQTILKAVANYFCEIAVDCESGRNGKFRKRVFHLLDFDAAAFRDREGLIENRRNLAKNAVHFLTRLEVELIRIKLHAVWIVYRLAGLDAQEDVMGAAIVLTHIVAVVRRRDPDAGTLAD